MRRSAASFDKAMRTLTFAIFLAGAALNLSASSLSFRVIGLDCPACAKPAIQAISSAGATNVRLDWKKGIANVDVADNSDRARIKTALTNAGFEAIFPGETEKGFERLPDNVVKTLDIASDSGKSRVDIAKLLAPGKITIVDFYADWCGPCHVLEARIERLMQANHNLALRRINIGKWDNAAAKQATEQFHAEALPYIRVYDAKGAFVAAVTGSMWDEVLDAVAKAKTR